MTKKQSMPDFTSAFTSALSADLREAAAKMRRMSQPPKHTSPSNLPEDKPSAPQKGEETALATPSEPFGVEAREPLPDASRKTVPDAGPHSSAQEEEALPLPSPSSLIMTAADAPEKRFVPPSNGEANAEKHPVQVQADAAFSLMTVNDSHQQSSTVTDCHESKTEASRTSEPMTVDDHVMTVIDCHQKHTQENIPLVPPHVPEEHRTLPIEPSEECKLSSPVTSCHQTPANLTLARQSSEPERAVPPQKQGEQNNCHQLSSSVINKEQSLVKKEKKSSTQVAALPENARTFSAASLQEAHLGGARQTVLEALLELRKKSPQVILNLKRLAPVINLSYGTVRNTISRLVREGVICTTQIRTGEAHGVCIEFLDDSSLLSSTVLSPMTVNDSHQQSSTIIGDCAPPKKMTVDDTSIWNTDSKMLQTLWPHAAKAGFTPAQLRLLQRAYQIQGWDAQNVARCLRYLDWELAHATSTVNLVAEWLRTMQQQGHYPRPDGYVDPEVLRLRQQAEEQAALDEARSLLK